MSPPAPILVSTADDLYALPLAVMMKSAELNVAAGAAGSCASRDIGSSMASANRPPDSVFE